MGWMGGAARPLRWMLRWWIAGAAEQCSGSLGSAAAGKMCCLWLAGEWAGSPLLLGASARPPTDAAAALRLGWLVG